MAAMMVAVLQTAAGCSGDDTAANGPSGGAGSASDAAIAGDNGGADVEAGPPLTCSPGTVLNQFKCSGDPYCRCLNYAPDGGTLVVDQTFQSVTNITSFILPQPMKSGQPYSLSSGVTNKGYTGTIEFWGTTSECGPGLQKLFSAPVESKVFCADVMPAQDFEHLLYVEHLLFHGGSASEFTESVLACPTGHCPSMN
jgi:hypothetical protein